MAEAKLSAVWCSAVAGVLLALAGCNAQHIPVTQQDGGVRQDAAPVLALALPDAGAQAPTVPAVRQASGQVVLELPGDEPWNMAGTAIPDAETHTLQLSAGAREFCWAIYGFSGLGAKARPHSLRITLAGDAPQQLWVGLANYTAQRWQWSQESVVEGVIEVALPAGTDWRNAAGSSFMALGVWDGQAARIGGCSQQAFLINPTALGDWPMLGHDSRRTARTTAPGLAAAEVKWSVTFDAGAGTTASPVIGPGGIVYTHAYSGALAAFNPAGNQLWSYTLPGASGSTPAIDDEGTAYLGCLNHVCAVAADGTLKWDYAFEGYMESSPALGADGTVYLGALAFDPQGNLLWGDPTRTYCNRNTPAVADNGTVYVGGWNANLLTAFHPDGSFAWHATGDAAWGEMFFSGPMVGDDAKIYSPSSWLDAMTMWALGPDGQFAWTTGQSGSGFALAPDGNLIAELCEGICEVNPSGDVIWTNAGYPGYLNCYSRPAVTGDGMIYACYKTTLWALNPDGTAAWNIQLANFDVGVLTSPAVALDGTVYVSDSHTLYALGLKAE
jgi:hypothetical protein